MSRRLFSCLPLSITLAMHICNGQVDYCTETEQCAGDSLSNFITACYGYLSCYQATMSSVMQLCYGDSACLEATMTTGVKIWCWGVDSCSSASISSPSQIICSSKDACSSSTLSVTDGEIHCWGDLSCSESTLTVTSGHIECWDYYTCFKSELSAADYISVMGSYGAAYSTISDTSSIIVSGYHGLENSYISTDGVDTFLLISSGDLALKNASLHCISGSECTVDCSKGSSCNKFNYYCYDGATCNLNCNDNCTVCPDIEYVSGMETNYYQSYYLKQHKKQQQETRDIRVADGNGDGVRARELNMNGVIHTGKQKDDMSGNWLEYFVLVPFGNKNDSILFNVGKLIVVICVFEIVARFFMKCAQKRQLLKWF